MAKLQRKMPRWAGNAIKLIQTEKEVAKKAADKEAEDAKTSYKILNRTFEAAKFPKGSPERIKLNESALTSEYMPSYKYIVADPDGKVLSSQSFVSKADAQSWIDSHKPTLEELMGKEASVKKEASKINSFWVVTKPTDLSTINDIMFETTIQGMENQFKGGLTKAEIVGIYTTSEEALDVATKLLVKTVKKEAAVFQEVSLDSAYTLLKDNWEAVHAMSSREDLEVYYESKGFKLDKDSLGKVFFAMEQRKKEEAPKIVPEKVEAVKPPEVEQPIKEVAKKATDKKAEDSRVNLKISMKVKIKDKIYDSKEEPLMIILTDEDKKNIANMLPECKKYSSFPDEMTEEEIEKFMGDKKEASKEASKKIAKLELWKHPQDYMGETYEDYYVVAGRSRDSDNAENINFDVALKELGGEKEPDVIIARASHWAVGWVETLLVHKDAKDKVKIAEDIVERLGKYPLLDEDAYYEKEREDYNAWFDENIEDYIEDNLTIFNLTEESYAALSDVDKQALINIINQNSNSETVGTFDIGSGVGADWSHYVSEKNLGLTPDLPGILPEAKKKFIAMCLANRGKKSFKSLTAEKVLSKLMKLGANAPASQNEFKVKDLVYEVGAESRIGEVIFVTPDSPFVEVKWPDIDNPTLVNFTILRKAGDKPKEEVKPEVKEEPKKEDKKEPEVKPTKLHEVGPKPKDVELPNKIEPSPSDITIAYEEFRQAQEKVANLKGITDKIIADAKKSAAEIETNQDLPGKVKAVDTAVDQLAVLMEKEGLAVTAIGDKLLALQSEEVEVPTKSKEEQIKVIKDQIEALQKRIVEIAKAAEPLKESIYKRILHIWNKNKEQKKGSTDTIEISADETSLVDELKNLIKSIKEALTMTKEINYDLAEVA